MPRRLPLVFSFALILAITALPAPARDYKPAHCSARQAYAGRPVHPPLAGVLAPAALTDEPFDTVTAQRLDDAFAHTQKAAAAPAMTAAVAVPGGGFWQKSVSPDDAPLLYWASAGKTFTAVVVLQLVEEGKLSLADPVSRWIDDVPNGDAVTVRDLLAHTSGLFSANEDRKARADPRYRDTAEALKIARRHGAMFCPGANWRYSNTGYDLLGEIVRHVDGRTIDAAITARIIERLGLATTRALRPGGGVSRTAPLVSAKEKPIDPSWPGAAGPIVSDAADMVRFWAALLAGRLLEPATVEKMFATPYPMFDPGTFYGLGVMVFEFSDDDRHNVLLGHAGGTPGAAAFVVYSPADKAFVAVALTGDGPASAVANTLLKALRKAQ